MWLLQQRREPRRWADNMEDARDRNEAVAILVVPENAPLPRSRLPALLQERIADRARIIPP
jgi:hypothetical protein